MSFFRHDLGDGYDLVLSDASTRPALFELTVANLDRLRLWESWAQDEPDESDTSFVRSGLLAFVDGTRLPCVIRHTGRPIGSISLWLDQWRGSVELGYWIDRDHEGRGAVRRAAEALIDHAFDELLLARIEIRTAAHNERSCALAERLGFTREGTLRSASPVGAERHDDAIYGLLAADRTPS